MQSFEQLVKRYNEIKREIRRSILKQQELRELGCLPRTSDLDGMPKAPGFNGSPVEKFIIRLDELEHEQMELEQKLETIRKEITIYIDKIPGSTIREVMEYKIFMSRGWRYIAHNVNYSVSRVRQFYDEGLAIIRKAQGDTNEIGKL